MGEEIKEEKKEIKKEGKKEEKSEETKEGPTKEVPIKEEPTKEEPIKEEPKKVEVIRSSRGRVRKSTQQFVFEEKEEKELEVPNGIGLPFGEIPNVNQALGCVSSGDPILRKFHNIVYPGQRCRKFTIKRNLRKFKGFDQDEDKEELTESVHTKFMRMDVRMIKIIADICNLSHVGTKEELLSHVIEFLFNPQSTGNPYVKPGQKPRKKKSTKKKATKKKKERKSTGPKRPPSSYFLFSNDNRASVREKNPGIKITEVAKKLGEMWGNISPEDRKPYD